MRASPPGLERSRLRVTRGSRRLRSVLVVSAVGALLAATAAGAPPRGAAQAPPSAREAASTYVPPDEFGRGTPRGTLTGFLEATSRHDYDRAAGYLDLRRVAAAHVAERGRTLARQLRVVLDHTPIDLDAVPDLPEGRQEPGSPSGRQLVARVQVDDETVSIVLEQGRRDDGLLVWRFSDATLTRVPALYAKLTYGVVGGAWLPPVFAEVRVLGLALWQWIGLLLLIAVSLLLARLLVRPGVPLTRRMLGWWGITLEDRYFERAVGPLRVLIALGVFRAGQPSLSLPLTAAPIIDTAQKLLLVVVLAWLAGRLIEVLCGVARQRLLTRQETATLPLIDLTQRALKISLAVLAVLLLLQALGVQISALVAAVGVGGIGLALAAQRIVENLFAGLALIGDQPVRVGEFCRFGDRQGIVERIGLWSTRVRTLERSVVSIPNASFVTLQIENLERRDRILFNPTLRLRYETTPDQLRWILVRIRETLYAHPRVDPLPARVRLVDFGPSSLNVEIFAYVLTTDFDEFLAVREELGLRIMDVVAAGGSAFALPSQTTYAGTDGLDRDKAAAAAAEVQRWRQEGQLPLPEFPPERVRALRASGDRRSG